MSSSISKDLHVLGTVQMQTTRPVLASNCLQLTYERETIDESGLAKSTRRPGDSLAHSSALWFLSTPTTNLCRTISIAGKEILERKWFGDHYKGLSIGDSNKHQEGQYWIKDASSRSHDQLFRAYKIWNKDSSWRTHRNDSAEPVIFSINSACEHGGGGR